MNVKYSLNNRIANTHASAEKYNAQYNVNRILDVGVLSIHNDAAKRLIAVDMMLRIQIMKYMVLMNDWMCCLDCSCFIDRRNMNMMIGNDINDGRNSMMNEPFFRHLVDILS